MMDTNYDEIASKYKRAKLQPWRTYIERHTLLRLVGDVSGTSAIDLACGEGYYTRELRRQGATPILGVDLSHEMIALAEAEEAREPLGIEYRVGDARDRKETGRFDLVFAAYLLNYAHTGDELSQMCRSIVQCLKPGGRFVTANNNPAEPLANFAAGMRYGYSKRLEGELVEGAPIIWRFDLSDGPVEVRNYYLSIETMEQAFREAGLRDVRWHAPEISPEGIQEFGQEHWSAFCACPPVVFITASG